MKLKISISYKLEQPANNLLVSSLSMPVENNNIFTLH